ncbi:NAD-dependent epimerase/dehydratase family protein [Perlabentimonas gracilis]|uniref:NAD-dependent epimerase/dehydratase family protein n=1 Tax=Perlabentimonas gracilis TaxID=2715279 RepID=UPI001F2ED9BC
MKASIIIGSTGLIGSKLHEILSNNPNHAKLHLVSRRAPSNLTEKSVLIPIENGIYSIPSEINYAFCCLGTTMRKAGSREAFRKVDFDMVVDFAQKAKTAGIERFAVVSSIGANPKSKNFYLKTKGQVEEELKKIGFARLVIVRPSLLLGKRNERRIAEDIGKVLYSIFSILFIGPLKKYKGIKDEDVAKAMIALVEQGQGTIIAESNTLNLYSKEYDAKR